MYYLSEFVYVFSLLFSVALKSLGRMEEPSEVFGNYCKRIEVQFCLYFFP